MAGIGNPSRFFIHVGRLGPKVVPHPFPDHHRFIPEELEFGDEGPAHAVDRQRGVVSRAPAVERGPRERIDAWPLGDGQMVPGSDSLGQLEALGLGDLDDEIPPGRQSGDVAGRRRGVDPHVTQTAGPVVFLGVPRQDTAVRSVVWAMGRAVC